MKINDIRYINSKINIINNETKTNFYNKFNNNLELEQKVAHDCFSLISLDSILRKNDDICYPIWKSVNIE